MQKLLGTTAALVLGLALIGPTPAGLPPTAHGQSTEQWVQIEPAGQAPAPRVDHTAVYDPGSDRLILFGGTNDDGRLADVWALSLSGTPTWTQLEPAGTAPPARSAHTAIYDPQGQRMIVFGGGDVNGELADVWALSLSAAPTWTQITPSGTAPPARANHTAVYDKVNQRMLVFAGRGGQYYRDVWALDLAGEPAWQQISATENGLWSQSDHATVFDPSGQRMIAFGGWRSTVGMPSLSQTVWSLTLNGTPAWSVLSTDGEPPAHRGNHTAVHDLVNNRMLVFGGSNPNPPLYERFGDVWALSLDGSAAWSKLADSGAGPAPRAGHAAAWDSTRQRMIVVGGFTGGQYLNDVWAFGASAAPTATTTSTAESATATPTAAASATAAPSTPVSATATPSASPTATPSATQPAGVERTPQPVVERPNGPGAATPTVRAGAPTPGNDNGERPRSRRAFLPTTSGFGR